jgi:hypothetical protein
MHHIHCERVSILNQESKIAYNFFNIFSAPFFSPMGHPASINLSPHYYSFFFIKPYLSLLNRLAEVVDADVSSFPVAAINK